MPNKTLIVADAALADLRGSLLALGHYVAEARDAEGGLQLLESGGCDLVLLEAAAVADAPALTREVRARFPGLEVVVAARESERSAGLACVADGAFAMVRLPLEPIELSAAVEHAVERRALLAGQQQMVRRLSSANRLAAMGQLASGVAHEVKNPVAYVIDNASYIAEMLGTLTTEGQEARVETLRQAAEEARDGAERIREIIRDIGALVSPDDSTRIPLDVNEAIRAAIRLTRFEVRNRVKVVTRLGAEARVLGSTGRLSQVFVNLIVNAAQAIRPDSGKPGRIAIISRREGSKVVAEISDNGPGIPRENLGRIFDAFFTTKPEGEGTGLGLFLCQDVVRRHSGEIRVRSSPQHGTTFTIELPADVGYASRGPEAHTAAETTQPEPRGSQIEAPPPAALAHEG